MSVDATAVARHLLETSGPVGHRIAETKPEPADQPGLVEAGLDIWAASEITTLVEGKCRIRGARSAELGEHGDG